MSLEIKKLDAELYRVKAARFEQDFKIAECEDQIRRLQENIKIQLERETELENKIKVLKGE